MKGPKSQRQTVVDTYIARWGYLNELCRTRVESGVISARALTPPVLGKSLLGLNPYRTVQWGGKNVYVDYRTVENYDRTIFKLSTNSTIWALVARLMATVTDPREDGVPYKVRRHLFSLDTSLEELFFDTWFRQSDLWRPKRQTRPSQKKHLFLVK